MNDIKTTADPRKSPAGRKAVPEHLRRKQRNIFVDEREWLAVRHYIRHTLRGEPLHVPKAERTSHDQTTHATTETAETKETTGP